MEGRTQILRRRPPLARWLTTVVLALATPVARALPTATQIATAFKALDTSGNAALNPVEWERGSFALFRAADKNQNDFIEADELQASTIAQDTFLRADTNRDGKLSVAEFMALRRAIFQIADIDRDESLTPLEFELLLIMEQVGWLDRNKNDHIELSELRESLAKIFEQLDADKDGAVTVTEAAYLTEEQFKRFDRDGDGKLTADEYIAGYRGALMGG